jgi:hypothetical protein
MKTTELRIGNLVQTNQGVFKVSGIQSEGLWICPFFSKESFSPNRKDIQPIPLTKKWLLNLGFEKGKYSVLNEPHYVLYSNYDYPFIVSVRYMDVYTEMQPLFGDKGIGLKAITDNRGIKYVHQLQNLYFALTGEELNYKPL